MLAGSVEDNTLTLLVFSERQAPLLALRLAPELFSTRAYRDIAEASLAYISRYHAPPGVHIRDLFEKELRRTNEEGLFLARTINAMEELYPSISEQFVLDELDKFISTRQLSNTLEESMEFLAQGKLEEARDTLYTRITPAASMSGGIWLHEPDQALGFLRVREEDKFYTGVGMLDEAGVVPARGTLTTMIATKGFGKSWFLVNCGKQGILHGRSTLHISLEMDESKVAPRYLQAVFSLTQEAIASVRVPMFNRNEQGFVSDVAFDVLDTKQIADSLPQLRHQLPLLKKRARLFIKSFPSGTFTIGQLEAFLDYLAKTHNFEPDQIILDYPGIMKLRAEEKRHDLGTIFVNLRGIAQMRDAAMIVVAQGNRSGDMAKTMRAHHAGEDFSYTQTSDIVLTGSRTDAERKLGLARMYVEKSRESTDGFSVLLSQAYTVGQFCLDSVRMSTDLDRSIKRLSGVSDDD